MTDLGSLVLQCSGFSFSNLGPVDPHTIGAKICKESNVLAPVYLALDPGGLQMAPHVILCDGVVAAVVSADLELLVS